LHWLARFGPGFRRHFRDLPVGHIGQTGEDFTQVSVRIEAAPAATFDDRADNRAALAGLGVADEQPVLLADGRGPSDATAY
jgi:hypothetical protein